MKFSNPFKNFRQRKTDISDLGKPKEPAEKPPEKPSGLFKKSRQRKADVAALAEKFNIIQKIPDPAERLLQCKQLQEDCLQTVLRLKGKSDVPGMGTLSGGFAMVFGGAVTLNVPLFWAGLFAMGAGTALAAGGPKPRKFVLSPALAKDCRTVAEIALKAEIAMETIILTEALSTIARSPRGLEAQFTFPALKARFEEAAKKDQSPKPAAPSHDAPAGPAV